MIIGAAAAAAIGRGAPAPTTAFYDTLLFNGSSQQVSVAHSNDFNFGSNDFSLSIWANLNDNGTQQALMSWGFGSPNNVRSWTLVYNWGTNEIEFYASTDGSTINTSFTASLTLSGWTHIALTRNGSTLTLYGDGVSLGTDTANTLYNNTSDSFYISGDRAGNIDASGSLSIPIIFNAALSVGDIAELQTPKQPENYSTGLKNKYACALPLNNGVIDPENDRSANNNDGTLVGSPIYTGTQLEFTS